VCLLVYVCCATLSRKLIAEFTRLLPKNAKEVSCELNSRRPACISVKETDKSSVCQHGKTLLLILCIDFSKGEMRTIPSSVCIYTMYFKQLAVHRNPIYNNICPKRLADAEARNALQDTKGPNLGIQLRKDNSNGNEVLLSCRHLNVFTLHRLPFDGKGTDNGQGTSSDRDIEGLG
jgi:hypothetical protein